MEISLNKVVFLVNTNDKATLSFWFIDMNNHYYDFQTYQGIIVATLVHSYKSD